MRRKTLIAADYLYVSYISHTRNVGDVKIIGRYQGFTPHCNFGVLYGVKLPTGSYTQTGTSTDPNNPGDTHLLTVDFNRAPAPPMQ